MSKGIQNADHETTHALRRIINSPAHTEAAGVDKEQIFTIYAGCCGDVAKTARACGVSLQQVIEYAEAGGWLSRISELIDLKKLDKFDDVARGLSRATNFVQANRFRLYLERVIRRLAEVSDDNLLDQFETKKVTKDGTVIPTGISLRVLADIASAMEKIHWMTYQALCDGTPERVARKAQEKPDDTGGDADVHAKISRMLASMKIKPTVLVAEDTHEAVMAAAAPATPAPGQ